MEEDKLPANSLELFLQLPRDKKEMKKHQGLTWLDERTWNFFGKLEESYDSFQGFCQDLLDHSSQWKLIYDAKEPDNLPLHEPWYSRLSKFERLLAIAALRPDKLLELVYTFVSEHVGFKFVEPPELDMGRAFSEAASSQPIICLTKGESSQVAAEQILGFATLRKQRVVECVSMGEDEERVKALETIKTLAKSGEAWLLLENVHLDPVLQRVLQDNGNISSQQQQHHSNFRLWLITEMTEQFPSLLLRESLKFSQESPTSLRSTLLSGYKNESVSSLVQHWNSNQQSKRERENARMLFCLVFFHSLLVMRDRYCCSAGAKFGWQDLNMAIGYLKSLSEAGVLNASSLRELAGRCCYELKATSEEERCLIDSILSTCVNEKAVSANRYRFSSSSQDFFVPNKTQYADYIEHIKGLPSRTDSELFELEPGFQLAADARDSDMFLTRFVMAVEVHKEAEESSSNLSLCQDLLLRVQESLLESDSVTSDLKWHWREEMDAHEAGLREAQAELVTLAEALRGNRVMDRYSEKLSSMMSDDHVPSVWLRFEGEGSGAISTSSFIKIISRRKDLLKSVLTGDNWPGNTLLPLNLLIFPTRYLAMLQMDYAKAYACSADEVELFGTLLKVEEEDARGSEERHLFKGVELQGANYDFAENVLVPRKCLQPDRSLILCLQVRKRRKVEEEEKGNVLFSCPLYKTRRRPVEKIVMESNCSSESLTRMAVALFLQNII